MSVFLSRLGLIAILMLAGGSGCASRAPPPDGRGLAAGKLAEDAAVAAAIFGPDNRLWRLIVSGQQLYVDASDDGGTSYGAPVAVTPQPQPILVRTEDRPSLAVGARGAVYVLYTAGAHEAPVTYLVYRHINYET